MTLETAPGGPDRPELMCVGSSGGLAIHLYDPVQQQVLCHRLRAGAVRMGPGLAPFELNGCTNCASAAAQRGYEAVLDTGGERVPLSGFRPATAD